MNPRRQRPRGDIHGANDIQWRNERLPDDLSTSKEANGQWRVFAETVPIPEVRTGAILALDRLAKKNISLHVQIMQILCAYIRENATVGQDRTTFRFLEGPDDLTKAEPKNGDDPLPLHEQWARVRKANAPHVSTRTDIRTALEVLSRRTRNADHIAQEAAWGAGEGTWPFVNTFPAYSDTDEPARLHAMAEEKRLAFMGYEGFRPDLRGADLRFSDLTGLDLRGAHFKGVQIQGADLTEAPLLASCLSDMDLPDNGAQRPAHWPPDATG